MDYFDLQAQAETIPYEERIRQAEREYAERRNRLERERDRALNEAYIARRIAERELPDRLAMGGYHGGLAETSELDLRNTYARNRRNLENEYAGNISDLELQEAGEVGDLRARIAAAQASANVRRAEAQARLARARSGGTSTKKYNFGFDNYYPGGVPQGVDYVEYSLLPEGQTALKATQLKELAGTDAALGYLDEAWKENRLDRRVYDRVKSLVR
jgi:multidrug efflux pump subunit AcrA (membrane-fusion protein)